MKYLPNRRNFANILLEWNARIVHFRKARKKMPPKKHKATSHLKKNNKIITKYKKKKPGAFLTFVETLHPKIFKDFGVRLANFY